MLMREAVASSSEAELKHESAIANVESMVDAEDLRELSIASESPAACSVSPEKADLNDMEFRGNSQFLNSKCVIEVKLTAMDLNFDSIPLELRKPNRQISGKGKQTCPCHSRGALSSRHLRSKRE